MAYFAAALYNLTEAAFRDVQPVWFGHTLGFAHQKEGKTITLDQLISRHDLPFFVKIDFEGHEPSALRGMSVPVPYLSFEVNLPQEGYT